MLPLSDGLHPRRFPFVTVLLIAANLAVWILYQVPHLEAAVYQLVEAHLGLASASTNGGGVAFFAHVSGFAFGAVVAAALLTAGRGVPQSLVHRPALARS